MERLLYGGSELTEVLAGRTCSLVGDEVFFGSAICELVPDLHDGRLPNPIPTLYVGLALDSAEAELRKFASDVINYPELPGHIVRARAQEEKVIAAVVTTLKAIERETIL